MKNIKVEYSWFKNSAITGVNQLPEHSEHYYFDKYVGINQLDYFQIDKIHLNNNWTYMKSDFNEKNGDDESTLVTLFNHFKGEVENAKLKSARVYLDEWVLCWIFKGT